jgi:3-hydroxyisobutyrate dehydrogenase
MSAFDETVAVLGAGGTMGIAIARNIARRGMELHAWNRTRRKMNSLAGDGAEICETPAEAAEGAAIVLSVLSDLEAVLHSMEGPDGALARMGKDSIWVQASTVGLAGTRRCAGLAGERGVQFVDAPVLGSKQPAVDGKLIVLASGPQMLQPRLQPVFDAIGQRTIWAGEVGAGSALKLVANCWLLSVVEGAAETIALAEGLGVDPGLFLAAIEGGSLDLQYLRMKASAMRERSFQPASFRLALAAKDAALMEQATREHDLDLPLITTLNRRFGEGASKHGDEDFAATFWTSAPRRPRPGLAKSAGETAKPVHERGTVSERGERSLAREQEWEAAREAREIGGKVAAEEGWDPAQRAAIEGGGGVAEGFELAEEDLIEHASHGDQQSARPGYHHRDDREEEGDGQQDGEADSFHSSETSDEQW